LAGWQLRFDARPSAFVCRATRHAFSPSNSGLRFGKAVSANHTAMPNGCGRRIRFITACGGMKAIRRNGFTHRRTQCGHDWRLKLDNGLIKEQSMNCVGEMKERRKETHGRATLQRSLVRVGRLGKSLALPFGGNRLKIADCE
jgi:hypothetical protein